MARLEDVGEQQAAAEGLEIQMMAEHEVFKLGLEPDK